MSDTAIKSVVMELSGKQTHKQLKSIPVYALFGITGNNYGNWTPAPGNYTLTANPYTETRARGKAGEAKTITITIVNSAVKTAIAANSNTPLMEEGTALNATIYPNPTSGTATLRFAIPKGNFISINLLDAGGAITQRLYSGKATGSIQQIQLQMERLKAGVYFARIMTTGGKWQVVQILKQ